MVKAKKPLTTIVGACLAAVAAGSLVLFSIFAQEATLGGSTDDPGVQVATPNGSAPVISLPGSSNGGVDGGAQNGAPGGSDEPLTGPLALLLEPLTPGELVAQLDTPDDVDLTGPTSTPPSAVQPAPGPGDGALARLPGSIERGIRLAFSPDERDMHAGFRALRSRDGGRPSAGDGGSEARGKSDGAGKGKNGKGKGGKGKGSKPGRGHGPGDKSNKGGKGHGRTKARTAKPGKEKKSKARKRSNSRESRAPSHSTGPPAHSKSKAPKPAPSKAKSPPGRGGGGGRSKAKKKN